MISRLLIANRGEIACRIARTCHRLGIETVAVYSEADASSIHLQGAANTVCLGPGPAGSSYLSMSRVVQAALESGCDAVHPGYGFLAENAAFAKAVSDAGLIFVGPRPETIDAMGDKARAKALMRRAGVPVIPGLDEASEDADRIVALVADIGFPALLKPTAGGGGKGMVVLEQGADIHAAVQGAVRQARASFGDGRLLVERFIQRPRHIEVQVFGDDQNNVVHLFERECSLQRRHQKIVEEAPALYLPEKTRKALRAAAVAGAQSINYRNAGTFEFIVDESGEEFFFLEMNTRLQVEHPVTEMITGLDLVEWQLRIAAGEPLPLAQNELSCEGHAIECRIYAEDPTDKFKPCPGQLLYAGWPSLVRIDAGVDSGSEVPAFYDPMIAKLIAYDTDRGSALAKMRRALNDTHLLGLKTNVGFLSSLLMEPQVVSGDIHTGFVDGLVDRIHYGHSLDAVACAAALKLVQSVDTTKKPQSPWLDARIAGVLDRGHLEPDAPLGRIVVSVNHEWHDVYIKSWAGATVEMNIDGESYTVWVDEPGPYGVWRGLVNETRSWVALFDADAIELQIDGNSTGVQIEYAAEGMDDETGTVAATFMPGLVAAVLVAPGDYVEKEQVVAVVEAMKMENAITSPMTGRVAEVFCKVGDTVSAGAVLVSFAEE